MSKFEHALRRLAIDAPADIAAPINRLVEALADASGQAISCSTRMDALSGNLHGAALASHELGMRLDRDIGGVISAHELALGRVDDQLQGAARQIERLAQALDSSIPTQGDSVRHVTAELGLLRQEIGETNRQLQLLISAMGDRFLETLARDPVGKSADNPIERGAS